MRVSAPSTAAVLVMLCFTRPATASPGPPALAAWERCVAQTEDRIRREMAAAVRNEGAAVSREPSVTRVQATEGCRPEDASAATIQQWRGSVLVPGVTVDALIESLLHLPPQQEDVVSARFLSRSGDSLRVQMRIVRHAVITVTYDTEHQVTFSRRGEADATSRSVMTSIDEVVDPGTPRERLREAGADRGFLWRLNSYFRYSAVAGGVRIDLESLTLSRGVPLLLRPLAAPIIDSIARESVTRALDGLRQRFGISPPRPAHGPASPRAPTNAIENRRGRVPLLDRDAHHAAAVRLDDVAADDRVVRPVGALDEHVGLQCRDDLAGRVLVENDRRVDARERGEDLGAFVLGRDRPPLALVRAHRSIGVDADDERVTEGACLPQVADVAGMEEIEDAVGEDHGTAGRAHAPDQGERGRRRVQVSHAACGPRGRRPGFRCPPP